MQRKTQEEKSPARLPGNHSGDNWWLSRLFSGAPVRELRTITNVACIQRGVSQRRIKQSRDNMPGPRHSNTSSIAAHWIWVGHACGETNISTTPVIPKRTSAEGLVNRPSTSKTG